MMMTKRLTPILLLAAAVLATTANASNNDRHKFKYEVTVTNITKGQVFSPPVLVTHTRKIALFNVGDPALDQLALVAEDGNGGPLVELVSTLPAVGNAQTTAMPLMPGASAIYEIKSSRRYNRLSIVGMLVNTNDAFFALDSESLPWSRNSTRTYYAAAYDAGSEGNNEDCGFIPGPACPSDSGNSRSTGDAEDFVHIHNGVHGIGDLKANAYDWRNPVAKITIRRTR
jgi:hypothetical protein